MEAISSARDYHIDVVLVDTAGRMQDNEPLMRALSKVGHHLAFNATCWQKLLDPRIWFRGKKNENGEIFLKKLRKIERKK